MRLKERGMLVSTGLSRMLLLAILVVSTSANAAFITVNTADDELNNDGDCSLLEAVTAANQNAVVDNCPAGGSAGTDEIFIAVTGTIDVSAAMLISERVEIFGPGMDSLTLDAQNLSQHFIVTMPDDSHDFDLSLMTLANGRESGPGGSIWLQRGRNFNFDDLRFLNNETTGSSGGAIRVQLPIGDVSRLTVTRSLFENNLAAGTGGAISSAGFPGNAPLAAVVITESGFTGNVAVADGGAIFSDDVDVVQIERSIFDLNESSNEGGGAVFLRGLDTSDLNFVKSSTFTNNRASEGGAVQLYQGASVIENSTFAGNRSNTGFGNALSTRFDAVVGVFHSSFIDHSTSSEFDRVISITNSSALSMGHSIVWSEGAAPDPECEVFNNDGSYTSLGFNIDTSGSCTGHATDLPMTDPQLAPLGDYGDSSNFLVLETFLPETTGPAVEGGKTSPCTTGFGAALNQDQRGQSRPAITRCDIGAVEFQAGVDPVAYALEVSIASGGGEVSSSPPGIDCPGDCREGYLNATTVTLTAEPAAGYQFTGWSGACSGTGPCIVSMTTARSVTASFAPTSDEIFSSRFEN